MGTAYNNQWVLKRIVKGDDLGRATVKELAGSSEWPRGFEASKGRTGNWSVLNPPVGCRVRSWDQPGLRFNREGDDG